MDPVGTVQDTDQGINAERTTTEFSKSMAKVLLSGSRGSQSWAVSIIPRVWLQAAMTVTRDVSITEPKTVTCFARMPIPC